MTRTPKKIESKRSETFIHRIQLCFRGIRLRDRGRWFGRLGVGFEADRGEASGDGAADRGGETGDAPI